MERDTFIAIVSPLALAMRAELDKPTWTVYFHALKDVHPNLLRVSIEVLLREPLTFFPKAGELRAAAERYRRALLATHPYEGCIECEQSKGWREVLLDGGPATVERCPCHRRHRDKLAMLGVLEAVALLPGEVGEDSSEQVYPTLAQLPESVRKQLEAVSSQKVLR